MATVQELEPKAREILLREQRSYEERNPKSRAAHERSSRVLPGGVSRILCYFPPFPCQTASGEGQQYKGKTADQRRPAPAAAAHRH